MKLFRLYLLLEFKIKRKRFKEKEKWNIIVFVIVNLSSNDDFLWYCFLRRIDFIAQTQSHAL